MSADNWTTCPKCKAEETLREDYEQWMDEEGVYNLTYRCGCKCGFRWEKEIKEQVNL